MLKNIVNAVLRLGEGVKLSSCKMFGRSLAFTLAEVLIVLGIIGIVAEMTIPTLISAQRKVTVEASLKKFYANMSQAVMLSENDNGDKKDWTYIGTSSTSAMNWFNTYLKDYLRTLKVEKDSNNFTVHVFFADGSAMAFNAWSFAFYPKASDFEKIIQVKDCGKKYFLFYWKSDDGLQPYTWSWDGNRASLFTNNEFGCKENPTSDRAYCTKLIQLNGWKIPDDYPIKF